MNRPQYLIVHTAAFEGQASIRDIDRWHRQRGFARVGYHYYIRRSGLVEQGRLDHEAGAHCLDMGMNTRSLGICFEGHGDLQPWTAEQKAAFLKLAAGKLRQYGIPPRKVLGHRETGAKKTCPGKLVDMDEVRGWLMLELHPEEKMVPLPPELPQVA